MNYKKIIPIVLVIFAQLFGTWQIQHSVVQTSFSSVNFPPGDTINGYIVGALGRVLKTTNSGANWMLVASGTMPDLNGVHFPENSVTGYIVGDSGGFYKTTDGGFTWERRNIGTREDLKGIWFVNENTGYVCGMSSKVFKTRDGGESWQDASPIGIIQTYLLSIHFLQDGTTGWTVGEYGVIYKTTNGGLSWETQNSGVSYNLNAVNFLTNDVGYVVGDSGTILKTITGGLSWTQLPSPVSYDLKDVIFPLNEAIGFICGKSGTVLKTNDGGTNWAVDYPTQFNLNSIHFPLNNLVGWAVGDSGVILKTSDGGIVAIESPKLEMRDEKIFSCQPNPFRNNVKIQFNGKCQDGQLKIFNCAGQLIYHCSLTPNGTINWNGRDAFNRQALPGVYLIELKTKEGKMQRTKIALLN